MDQEITFHCTYFDAAPVSRLVVFRRPPGSRFYAPNSTVVTMQLLGTGGLYRKSKMKREKEKKKNSITI